jgi:hypothetical protein
VADAAEAHLRTTNPDSFESDRALHSVTFTVPLFFESVR